jgi:SAM-dependent methyltransferase
MPIVPALHDVFTRRKMERLFRRREDPYRYRSSTYERARIEKIDEIAGRFSGSVLELGCGEGEITARLAQKFGRVVAVDISSTALARARERLSAAAAPAVVTTIRGNVRDWIAQPSSDRFDLIIVSELLYYLGDRWQRGIFWERPFRAFLRNLVSRLQPGGRILLAHGFGTPFEQRIREDYGRRLLPLGIRRLESTVVGEGMDKGNMRCLIELFGA